MRTESAVEPTKSENITVTWRRSARSSGVLGSATIDDNTNSAATTNGQSLRMRRPRVEPLLQLDTLLKSDKATLVFEA